MSKQSLLLYDFFFHQKWPDLPHSMIMANYMRYLGVPADCSTNRFTYRTLFFFATSYIGACGSILCLASVKLLAIKLSLVMRTVSGTVKGFTNLLRLNLGHWPKHQWTRAAGYINIQLEGSDRMNKHSHPDSASSEGTTPERGDRFPQQDPLIWILEGEISSPWQTWNGYYISYFYTHWQSW